MQGESHLILLTSLTAWFIAQALKVIITFIKIKRIDFEKFISSGGMPSSHSALVSSLTTKVGLVQGVSSPLFATCLIFSLIIMYDAAGVRHAAGKQAEVLNKLVDDFYHNRKLYDKRLKELLGHTPTEVFAGMFLGIFIAFIL